MDKRQEFENEINELKEKMKKCKSQAIIFIIVALVLMAALDAWVLTGHQISFIGTERNIFLTNIIAASVITFVPFGLLSLYNLLIYTQSKAEIGIIQKKINELDKTA